MKLFLRVLMIAVTAIAITACSNSKKNTIETIEGTAYYLQRIALPQNAMLDVTLNDVTASGSPIVLNTQQFPSNGKQVPLAFTFKVPKDIDSDKRYSLSATITDELGEKIFATNREYLVLTDADKTSTVKLQLMSSEQISPQS